MSRLSAPARPRLPTLINVNGPSEAPCMRCAAPHGELALVIVPEGEPKAADQSICNRCIDCHYVVADPDRNRARAGDNGGQGSWYMRGDTRVTYRIKHGGIDENHTCRCGTEGTSFTIEKRAGEVSIWERHMCKDCRCALIRDPVMHQERDVTFTFTGREDPELQPRPDAFQLAARVQLFDTVRARICELARFVERLERLEELGNRDRLIRFTAHARDIQRESELRFRGNDDASEVEPRVVSVVRRPVVSEVEPRALRHRVAVPVSEDDIEFEEGHVDVRELEGPVGEPALPEGKDSEE